jgi:DNA polymerase-4
LSIVLAYFCENKFGGDMERVILHSDMNNFYASVECMLNPELKAYPIAVCGDVEERHGIVLAKNYKAKAKGVSTG